MTLAIWLEAALRQGWGALQTARAGAAGPQQPPRLAIRDLGCHVH